MTNRLIQMLCNVWNSLCGFINERRGVKNIISPTDNQSRCLDFAETIRGIMIEISINRNNVINP